MFDVTLANEIECSPGLPMAVDPLGVTVEDEQLPLTFIAVTDATVELRATGSPTTSGLKYRLNSYGDWLTYTPGTEIQLSAGRSVQFYNTQSALSNASNSYVNFHINGQVNAVGDCISLLNYSTTATPSCFRNLFDSCSGLLTCPRVGIVNTANYCFLNLFSNCTSISKSPKLVNEDLAQSCFSAMFQGCTSLKQPPLLPIKTLTAGCYNAMFQSSGIEAAPELPATTLASACYSTMFRDCSALTSAPSLSATGLEYQCYRMMFYGCTSLVNPPELPATTLAEQCYLSMFQGCTELVKAPKLPATTLELYCYSGMLYGCTKLNEIEVGFTSWDDTATGNWARNTAATGTFTKPSDLPEEYGYNRIPSGWTVINKD